ncbi:hypothetical protein KI387_043500 [Taxus chinensis]|uniref:Thioredoxin domain-containing protein n=2 Tax=Taxus chinensis TaxID=29808 RepID=A0AA38BZ65_TAXCH|nr:hypothetical protein KI387_043500 [Taxus chinensis]
MAEVLRGSASFMNCSTKSGRGCVSTQYSAKVLLPKTVSFRSNVNMNPLCFFSDGLLQGYSARQAKGSRQLKVRKPMKFSVQVYATQTCIPRTMRWWEKGTTPNMREAHSAQELIDSLVNAGDKLVVLNFFAPGCGACRSLHPKICQLAGMHSDVEFVKVNYEENKSMCYSLNIHVLPFFQFYRGAQGRLCSFSCTNATIKKFKDALAKHNTPRCSLGPPLGFEESQLLALSNNKSLSFNMPTHVGTDGKEQTKFIVGTDKKQEDLTPVGAGRNLEDSVPPSKSSQKSDEPALVGAGR